MTRPRHDRHPGKGGWLVLPVVLVLIAAPLVCALEHTIDEHVESSHCAHCQHLQSWHADDGSFAALLPPLVVDRTVLLDVPGEASIALLLSPQRRGPPRS